MMLDLKSIGRHMSRERYQRGSLRKVGTTRKQWEGLWHVYVPQPNGTEKRLPRTRILGPGTMIKAEAQKLLDRLIEQSRTPTNSIHVGLPAEATFAQVWTRYRGLKEGTWGAAQKKAICSLFEGATTRKRSPSICKLIGSVPVRAVTREPLQHLLNDMANSGASFSTVKKTRTYLAAAFEFAMDEKLIPSNPARKLELPTKLVKRKPCRRFLSLHEIQALLRIAPSREHVVLKLFFVCGLRPSELFLLREDDLEHGRIRIDQALKEAESGDDRIGAPGDTKTAGSAGYVAISSGLQRELEDWLRLRDAQAPWRARKDKKTMGLLFPSETGTPFRIGNYLKRVLKPLALQAGIPDLTYQALRRTCATYFQRHGGPRDIQAHLRHTNLATTGIYVQAIPSQIMQAVEDLDAEFSDLPVSPS
jgi:integrase